jgi:hypothetical protein
VSSAFGTSSSTASAARERLGAACKSPILFGAIENNVPLETNSRPQRGAFGAEPNLQAKKVHDLEKVRAPRRNF